MTWWEGVVNFLCITCVVLVLGMGQDGGGCLGQDKDYDERVTNGRSVMNLDLYTSAI